MDDPRSPEDTAIIVTREPQRAAGRGAVSIVLPAFDEEQGLIATLAALHRVLDGDARAYEIVVVDDGSTDGTPALLAARTDVTVVRHEKNRGYGAALKAGIRAARHPLIVVMDADATYPVEAIPSLVERCAAADMVVGARLGPRVQPTPARSAVKWIFRQFAQWITAAPIPDLNSGLRVFRRPVAERFMDILPDGFSFTTTITVGSLVERLPVRFEPVDYMPRIGRSKVRPARDTVRIARQLLRLGIRFAPLRTTLAAVMPLLIFGMVSSAYHLLERGHLTVWDLTGPALGVVAMATGARAEQRVRRRRSVAADTCVGSQRSSAA